MENNTSDLVSFEFAFERDFDLDRGIAHLENNLGWVHLSAFLYVAAVFAGKRFMENREPLRTNGVRLALIAWNIMLAVYSATAAWRMIPIVIKSIQEEGLQASICSGRSFKNNVTSFWVFTFTMSKFVEFGDTAFIIIKKQPLIFLHWYHHVLTMLMCVWCQIPMDTPFVMATTINLSVHSIMYSYYALRAYGVKVPNIIAQQITTIQMIQFVIGLYIYAIALIAMNNNEPCNANYNLSVGVVLMLISYLALFGHFFVKKYIAVKSSKVTSKQA